MYLVIIWEIYYTKGKPHEWILLKVKVNYNGYRWLDASQIQYQRLKMLLLLLQNIMIASEIKSCTFFKFKCKKLAISFSQHKVSINCKCRNDGISCRKHCNFNSDIVSDRSSQIKCTRGLQQSLCSVYEEHKSSKSCGV